MPLPPAQSAGRRVDVGGLPLGFRLELTHSIRISSDDFNRKPWHALITSIPICGCEWFKGSGETADEALLKAFAAVAQIYGMANANPESSQTPPEVK